MAQHDETEEQKIDYWSIPSLADGQLNAYQAELRFLKEFELKLHNRVMASTAIGGSLAFWLYQNEKSLPSDFKSVSIFLFVGLFWFLFWQAISILRMYPNVFGPRRDNPHLVAFRSATHTHPLLMTSLEWKARLVTTVSKYTLQLENSNSAFKLGLGGAVFIALGAFVSAIVNL